MQFQEELTHTLSRTPANLEGLSELIDPAWITQALQATGSASVRKRKLPAEHVVWLVIGLALFRNQPIWGIVHQLQLSLGDVQCAPSAAVQGRQRLGDAALEHLFRQLTTAWSSQIGLPKRTGAPALAALRVLAVDGVVWSAPDSTSNRQALGCCSNQHGQGSWPQLRAVCLMDTFSHELLDAQLGAMTQGELTLAQALQPPPGSVTVFDRAYFSAAFLLDWQARGAQCH